MAKEICLSWDKEPETAPVLIAKKQEIAAGWWMLAGLVMCQVALWLAGLHRPLHGSTDFRAFYSAGHMVANGHAGSMYRYADLEAVQKQFISTDGQTLPFLYPPFAVLLFAPLSMLPYVQAYWLFTGINIVALVVTGWWIRDLLGRRDLSGWTIAAACICALPVVMALEQGQISFLLLLAYVWAERKIRRKREFSAGLVLALGLAKFQILIPIILLFCCWKRWRIVAGVLTGAGILGLVSLAVVGWSGIAEYLSSMLHITARTASDPAGAHAAYGMLAGDMPNIHGMVFLLSGGAVGSIWLTLLFSVALLFWAARQKPSLALALCAAMLVSYHMQAYDLTLLLLAIAVVAEKMVFPGSGRAWREQPVAWLWWVAVVMLTVPVAPVLLILHLPALFCVPIAVMLIILSKPMREITEL